MATPYLVLLFTILGISVTIRIVLTATLRLGRRPPNRNMPDLERGCHLGEAAFLERTHDPGKPVVILSHEVPERYSRDAVSVIPYSTRRQMKAKRRGFEETMIKSK